MFLALLMGLSLSGWSQISGQLISSRLDSIQNVVELDYNGEVKERVNRYLRNRDATTTLLERFLVFDDEMASTFRSYDAPEELRYACMAISNCDLMYKDDEGRTGYFGLRYNVAKKRDIVISNFVDERRDPLESAEAFCKEMKAMYHMYGDWKEVITIYYVGRLEWEKARSKANDSTDNYWNIIRELPDSVSAIYFDFVAAAYIANYYSRHGIRPEVTVLETTSVEIKDEITLDHLAGKLALETDLLTDLNPIYKNGVIPKSTENYFATIPKESVELFHVLGDSLYYVPKDTTKKEEEEVVDEKPQPSHYTLYYTVRSGDVLSYIADYYDCYVSDIKRWNGLRSSRINVNQRLRIMVPAHKYDYYKRINGMTRAQKRQIAARD